LKKIRTELKGWDIAVSLGEIVEGLVRGQIERDKEAFAS